MEKAFYKRPHYLSLWVHILLSANHHESEFLWNGQVVVVKPGQFITGRKQLSAQSGIPETTVEDILSFLEREQQIRQQKTTKYRLITVLKWHQYQDFDNKATTKRQQADTNKNDKKEKNVYPESVPSSGSLTVTNSRMYKYTAVDEDGNPRRTKQTKPKEISERNKELIKIGFIFEKMVEKTIGEKPPLDKAYFILKNAKEKLGVDDFEDLFTYFLADPKLTPEQKISLPFCCSQQYIAKWKVSRKNKKVSQIEASADIIL